MKKLHAFEFIVFIELHHADPVVVVEVKIGSVVGLRKVFSGIESPADAGKAVEIVALYPGVAAVEGFALNFQIVGHAGNGGARRLIPAAVAPGQGRHGFNGRVKLLRYGL